MQQHCAIRRFFFFNLLRCCRLIIANGHDDVNRIVMRINSMKYNARVPFVQINMYGSVIIKNDH